MFPAPTSDKPPRGCPDCGGVLEKTSKGIPSDLVAGCLFTIVGLLLLFWLPPVGLVFLLLGGHLLTRRKGLWRCRKCRSTFPRKLRWYDLS